jgi:acyl-CoA reductase-like NAD-dependent aldehyde dehydrogenase
MSENTSVNPGVFIDGSWQDCDAARLVSQSPIDGSEVAAFSVAGEDAAGRTIDAGIAGLAGQACTATSRAIVFESVHDEYLDRLVTAIEDLTVGDPLDEETDVGPKYSESGLETDLEYIEAGREEGATLVTGGKRLTGGSYDDGYFVEPTVFADVDPEIRIAKRKSSGRCCRSSRLATTTRPSRSPTASTTDSRRHCVPTASTGHRSSPTESRPGW